MSPGHAVGIDFGTTNSVVAHGTVASASVLTVDSSEPIVPSVVSFTDRGALVGRSALDRTVSSPELTVRSVKRSLGDGRTTYPGVDGAEYTPEQVASLVFSKLKERAEVALGGPVTNAVVTVPAYFDHRQREATQKAAEIAGLQVDRLLSEPTAACLSYGVGAVDGDGAETVLVYDLGGGTFDVSLVDVTGGVFDVVASKGDTNLGGDDWDERLLSWLRSQLNVVEGDDERWAPVTEAQLRQSVKQARHELSERPETTIELVDADGVWQKEVELTREHLDEQTEDLAQRTVDICDELLQESGTNPWSIDRVLLVGGATRMPQIRETVYDFFGEVPSKEVSPDQLVATGAAIQANILDDGPATPQNHSHTDGGRDTVVVDVVPRPLGVETSVDGEPGYFSPVVEAHSSIPVERTRRYRTIEDDQTTVSVRVYQGDADRVEDDEYLGSFVLSGLPEAPAGEVSVAVTFEVTESGLLEVRAAEDQTGRAAGVTIESAFDGPDGEIRRAREGLPVVL